MRSFVDNPLELVTADELVAELNRRFPTVVVVTVGLAKETDDEDEFHLWYHGGLTAAIGAAERARDLMCRDARRAMRRG